MDKIQKRLLEEVADLHEIPGELIISVPMVK